MITMNSFPEKYNHREIEKKWQDSWKEQAVYKWDEQKNRENNFVIDTPPPTVSGLLHMGHVFSYTQADFIARYQRMKGKNVFYPMGFDDNGLPTERLVEKIKKIRARDLPREEFKKLCTQVIEESEQEFQNLFNRIGLSVDWSQKYQTVSEHAMAISQMSFLDLYNKHHIYRSLEPTIWDPIDRTALAQTDLEDIEHPGMMNEIEFSTEEGQKIHIATTRPELMPACVAVLFNPNDARYKTLAGKNAITPLFNITIPIIADENVDLEKGTGLVMCCTFGDATDIEWWRKYKLPTRIVLDHEGKLKLQDTLPELAIRLEGKKVKDARESMITILHEHGLLKSQNEVTRMVKCAERSKAPIEILVSMQWFVRVLDKKPDLLKKVGECNWHPEFMKHRLENWINGLKWDWCISRQRYFGVPFPVWYSKRVGEEGKVLLASKDQLPVDPLASLPKGYSRHEVEPDMDIMDTWATSSVTPQINSYGINGEFFVDAARHRKLFPADLRPQSHEIIRTWAFSTIVKSMLHQNSIPWKNLMISGWVLASDKTKMSKSKGNVVTPIDFLDEKGADVVRYWASSSKLGADVAYSEDMFKIAKKLITKLWNAAKFCALHLNNTDPKPKVFQKLDFISSPERPWFTLICVRGSDREKLEDGLLKGEGYKSITNAKNIIDKWLLSKLHNAARDATMEFEKFEYCNARAIIEDFFWHDFCDNYLELIKKRIYDEDNTSGAGKDSAVATLSLALEVLLKLFAPFLPHITEELYSLIYNKDHSIHFANSWPNWVNIPCSNADQVIGEKVLEIVEAVRKFKAERNLSIKAPLALVNVISKESLEYLGDAAEDLKAVTTAEELLLNGPQIGGQSISTVNFQVFIYEKL